MTLETALRLPFSLPRLLRAHADEPEQDYHWVGKTGEPPRPAAAPGGTGSQPPHQAGETKYRPLGNIPLGEVEEAIGLFKGQLLPAYTNWIVKNHFCTIPLKRMRDGRPPQIFGLVTTCFPSDGHIENIEDVELLFPRPNAPPDLLRLRREEISTLSGREAQSYFVRVQVKVSAEEAAEFDNTDALFHSKGFHPEFDGGYYDLLEMNEQSQAAHAGMYVIGSRWLASIPDSLYGEVASRLKEMLGWGKVLLNYHPAWLPTEIRSLNRALGLKYKLTKEYLTEPETPDQTARLAARLFKETFLRGYTGA